MNFSDGHNDQIWEFQESVNFYQFNPKFCHSKYHKIPSFLEPCLQFFRLVRASKTAGEENGTVIYPKIQCSQHSQSLLKFDKLLQ